MEITRASEPLIRIYLLPVLEDCELFKANILATVVNVTVSSTSLKSTSYDASQTWIV